MIAPVELMREAESYGAAVDISGGQVILVRGKLLPASLLEKMRAAKPDILEVMERDRKTKEAGFMTLHSGEVYEKRIADNSHIFVILNESGEWDAWRETWSRKHQDGSESLKAIGSKEIVAGTNFEMALVKVAQYLHTLARWKGK